jgi:hypothetical protein
LLLSGITACLFIERGNYVLEDILGRFRYDIAWLTRVS